MTECGDLSWACRGLARETLRERLAMRCPTGLRSRFDLIGVSSVFDGDDSTWAAQPNRGSEDLRLRLAVEHNDKAVVELATQELLALYCCGPAGGGGVRRHHTPRLKTASFLVPRHQVTPTVKLYRGESE